MNNARRQQPPSYPQVSRQPRDLARLPFRCGTITSLGRGNHDNRQRALSTRDRDYPSRLGFAPCVRLAIHGGSPPHDGPTFSFLLRYQRGRKGKCNKKAASAASPHRSGLSLLCAAKRLLCPSAVLSLPNSLSIPIVATPTKAILVHGPRNQEPRSAISRRLAWNPRRVSASVLIGDLV
jgi:hypothetical protein